MSDSFQRDAMSVQRDDRGFRLIYRTLGAKRRIKVGTRAFLGRRASDPETAWLVYMFSLQQLRLRWLRLPLGITLLAVSVWLFAQTRSLHLLLVLQFAVGIVIVTPCAGILVPSGSTGRLPGLRARVKSGGGAGLDEDPPVRTAAIRR